MAGLPIPAVTGGPALGPVHLRIKGRLGRLTGRPISIRCANTYACAPGFRPKPVIQRVKDVMAWLTLAEKPVIVAVDGGGVMRCGAGAEFVELAEKLNIPAATALNAKACKRDVHPFNVMRTWDLCARLRPPRAAAGRGRPVHRQSYWRAGHQ